MFVGLLLGAHFFRMSEYGITVVCILFPSLMIFRQRWALHIVIIFILSGAMIWIQTGVSIVLQRTSDDLPFVRAGLILAGVAAIFCLPLLFLTKQIVRDRFSASIKSAGACTTAFMVVFIMCAFPQGLLHHPIPLLAERFIRGAGWIEIFFLSLYAAILVEKLYNTQSIGRLRKRIWLTFSIIFFLQALVGLCGIKQCLMTGNLHLPVPAMILAGPIISGGGFFMPILFMATVVLAGPTWCSWLCYWGSWDNIIAGEQSNLRRRPIKNHRTIQIIIVFLMILFSVAMRHAGASTIISSIFGACFGFTGIAIMIFISRKLGTMTHCTSYCPMGLIATIFGKINPLRIKIDNSCGECNACSRICNYGALTSQDLRRRSPGNTCTLCGDCTSICHNGRITFHFPGLSTITTQKLFIVTVVSIHAIFLGFARL